MTDEKKLDNFWEDPEKIKQYIELRSLWHRCAIEAEPFRLRVNNLIFEENQLVSKHLKYLESWGYSFKYSLLPKFRSKINGIKEELRDISRLINIAKRLHEEKAAKLQTVGIKIEDILGLRCD